MKTYEKIKSYIENTGLKKYVIAERCGYSAKALSQIINGRKVITEKDITKLCIGLGVTPNDLIAYESL